MSEQDDILADLLELPVAEIDIGKMHVLIRPAGLPEMNDLHRKLTAMQVEAGDLIPNTTMMWGYIFWLLVRQGTPGMTPERIFAGDWEFPEGSGLRLFGMYRKTLGVSDAECVAKAKDFGAAAGLLGEEDEEGEAESGETRSSPPPNDNTTNGSEET